MDVQEFITLVRKMRERQGQTADNPPVCGDVCAEEMNNAGWDVDDWLREYDAREEVRAMSRESRQARKEIAGEPPPKT